MTGQPKPHDLSLARGPGEREESCLSRTTETCAFGKCVERIDVMVPEELKHLLSMLAALEGKAPGTYIRKVLEVHAILEREKLQRIVQTFGGSMNGGNPA